MLFRRSAATTRTHQEEAIRRRESGRNSLQADRHRRRTGQGGREDFAKFCLSGCSAQECREVRVACGDLKRPLAFWSTDRADRRDQLFEGSQGGTPCPVIWCCASYPTGYYLAQNGGRSSSSAAAHSPGKLLKWKKPPLNLIPKSGKSNQNRFT